MSGVSYKDAGVDIDAGNEFVSRIKPLVSATFDKHVLGSIGSFAGAYELPSGYKKPVLLGATDGVGTKLKLAIDSNRLNTVGIDLVAMCVNDLICNFAKPAFFLDYYATGHLDIEDSVSIVSGIADGCKRARCSLIGGESAEMPGMYHEHDFDLAGFAVGIGEKDELDRTLHVKDGDILVALPSSGIHSNGYSLVRKLFFETLGYTFDTPFNGKPIIDILLEPTRIYVDEFISLKDKINALAHITGGGLVENVPRILPDNLQANIEKSKLRVLPIFDFMANHVNESEMFRTFNMGVGLVLCISKENIEKVLSSTDGYIIGEITKGEKGAVVV